MGLIFSQLFDRFYSKKETENSNGRPGQRGEDYYFV
jgi:hypothetical protein